MKSKQIAIAFAAITSVFFSGLTVAAPPTPDVNVVNTPDVNVVNTPDVNVVTTVDSNVVNTPDVNVVNEISVSNLVGADLGPFQTPGVNVFFVDVVRLRAISTSIAPATAGDLCNVVVGGSLLGDPASQPLGLSVMSNGEAATVSRNYETPITLNQLNFDISSSGDLCWISFSVVAESIPEALGAAAETEPRVHIEVR